MELSPTDQNNNWNNEEELYLKKLAEKGLCLKIMHNKAYKKYLILSGWFTLPVIILNTITGSVNFIPGGNLLNKDIITYVTGTINIFVAIISTLANYFEFTKYQESHRMAYLSWDKFINKIESELTKPREERYNIKDFLKICSDEYDKLVNLSPIFTDDIIKWMNEFIEFGIEEEDNIDNKCVGLYSYVLFPCNCRNLCKCLMSNKKKTNEENINIFKNMEKPDILGYINLIKISKLKKKDST